MWHPGMEKSCRSSDCAVAFAISLACEQLFELVCPDKPGLLLPPLELNGVAPLVRNKAVGDASLAGRWICHTDDLFCLVLHQSK